MKWLPDVNLLVALLSYDRKDLPATSVPFNKYPSNWIGLFGAWIGFGLFQTFGAAAYLLPFFCLAFGLANFFEPLAYLRRRWLSAAAFLLR